MGRKFDSTLYQSFVFCAKHSSSGLRTWALESIEEGWREKQMQRSLRLFGGADFVHFLSSSPIFSLVSTSNSVPPLFSSIHRRRIYTEATAKVVASVRECRFGSLPCRASCFASVDWEKWNRMNSTISTLYLHQVSEKFSWSRVGEVYWLITLYPAVLCLYEILKTVFLK